MKLGEEIEKEIADFIDRLHKFDEFFSKDYPSKIIVKNENCIKLHKVNGIGLFSDFKRGILHAFFSIKANECLKQPPIEFSVYILHGKGILKADNDEYHVSLYSERVLNFCDITLGEYIRNRRLALADLKL